MVVEARLLSCHYTILNSKMQTPTFGTFEIEKLCGGCSIPVRDSCISIEGVLGGIGNGFAIMAYAKKYESLIIRRQFQPVAFYDPDVLKIQPELKEQNKKLLEDAEIHRTRSATILNYPLIRERLALFIHRLNPWLALKCNL